MIPNYVAYIYPYADLGGNFVSVGFSVFDTANHHFVDDTTVNINLNTAGSEAGLVTATLAALNSWATTNGYTPIQQISWHQSPDAVVASMISAAAPYKNYQSVVSQTGTSAPTEVVGNNAFTGVTFTWARTSAGVYTITASSGVFTSGKTAVFLGSLTNLNGSFRAVVTSSSIITITTAVQSLAVLGLLGFTANPTDALLSGTLMEVRVYP